MKKLTLIAVLAVLGAFSLSAAPKKLYFDRFDLPLRRTYWMKFAPTQEAWEKEFKYDICGVRWLVRSSGDVAALSSFKVLNADGKIIMQSQKLKRFDWVNFHGKGPYTVKVAGKAHAKTYHLVLDIHDNEDKSLPGWKSRQMISWSMIKCTAAAAEGGGAKLTAGKTGGRLHAPVYNLKAKTKYRAELSISSETAQSIKMRLSCKGRKAEKVQELQPGKPQTVTVELVGVNDTINVDIFFNGEVKVDKFYFWEVK